MFWLAALLILDTICKTAMFLQILSSVNITRSRFAVDIFGLLKIQINVSIARLHHGFSNCIQNGITKE